MKHNDHNDDHANHDHHNHNEINTEHKHDHSHHGGHDHSQHEGHDHSQHEGHDHSGHDHSGHGGHGGHGDHAHHGDFKKIFFTSLIFGVPILFLSPMMGVTLPFQFSFLGSDWLVMILATILFFYGGSPFLKGAKDELKQKSPAMMTLIALGISVAYVYSMYAFVANTLLSSSTHVMDFFWELASLILIMLLGHWIEMDAVASAGNALQKMAALLPSDATRLKENGETEVVALSQINANDIVVVKAGENMPVDGVIIEGETNVNEAMITGESLAVKKKVGDQVIGGSVNGFGTVQVQVTGTGSSGYLAQVMQLVETASNDKSKAESMADVVAKWLFYIALVVGIIALIVWTALTNVNTGIERMVTVLVIACPHALGLAIPLVTARSTSIGAQNGLLVKKRDALEIAQKLDMIMMDKTGTLTEGNFKVMHFSSSSKDYTDLEMLEIFASLESHSSHPLAVGIMDEAEKQGVKIQKVDNIQTIAGVGLSGTYQSKDLRITSAAYLDKENIAYDKDQFMELTSKGYSVSYLVLEGVEIGVIAQGDEIKESSKAMVKTLLEMGITPVMLTGDNAQAAKAVAKQLGIDHVHAELLPEDKERLVREYQGQGKVVMMVGDGVNDAPSLVRADIGVAIGAGTDVAIDAAEIILVKSEPSDIINFLRLSKQTTRKMKQNLIWGAGYNFLAIPLAAGILAGVGFILSPAVGAVLMSLSTVIVAINAMFLKL